MAKTEIEGKISKKDRYLVMIGIFIGLMMQILYDMLHEIYNAFSEILNGALF